MTETSNPNVLVTGGAGFIGSNFVRYALGTHADWHVTTLDKLTYAGRKENLHDVIGNPRHTFVHGDICDAAVAAPLVEAADIVVHFAAETHVDRSILAAGDFIKTDVEGSFVLLEAARRNGRLRRFVQISTDEVYGTVPEGSSSETDELRPRNPYSASKAGADRLAYSYWATHDVPVIVTRASNNYGPYRDGGNVRDWLHVVDHCRALDLLIHEGRNGEVYNIGGGNEVKNVDLTCMLLGLLGKDEALIRRVEDRKGHDRRYSVSTAKLRAMGWTPSVPFEQGLRETVAWYQENEWWWRPVKERDPEYRAYLEQQYGSRASR
jgi:dTDP-glucose 4,6-dehydratase